MNQHSAILSSLLANLVCFCVGSVGVPIRPRTGAYANRARGIPSTRNGPLGRNRSATRGKFARRCSRSQREHEQTGSRGAGEGKFDAGRPSRRRRRAREEVEAASANAKNLLASPSPPPRLPVCFAREDRTRASQASGGGAFRTLVRANHETDTPPDDAFRFISVAMLRGPNFMASHQTPLEAGRSFNDA